jgi:transposase
MDDAYGKLRVTAVLRNGRRRFDPISKAHLVDACLQPGVSVARLALEYGVNANLLRKWVKQRKDQTAVSMGSAFASPFMAVRVATKRDLVQHHEVRVPESSLPCRAQDSVAVDGKTRFLSPATLQATLPNGVKLTLGCGDVDVLTTVIGALGHVQTGC